MSAREGKSSRRKGIPVFGNIFTFHSSKRKSPNSLSPSPPESPNHLLVVEDEIETNEGRVRSHSEPKNMKEIIDNQVTGNKNLNIVYFNSKSATISKSSSNSSSKSNSSLLSLSGQFPACNEHPLKKEKNNSESKLNEHIKNPLNIPSSFNQVTFEYPSTSDSIKTSSSHVHIIPSHSSQKEIPKQLSRNQSDSIDNEDSFDFSQNDLSNSSGNNSSSSLTNLPSLIRSQQSPKVLKLTKHNSSPPLTPKIQKNSTEMSFTHQRFKTLPARPSESLLPKKLSNSQPLFSPAIKSSPRSDSPPKKKNVLSRHRSLSNTQFNEKHVLSSKSPRSKTPEQNRSFFKITHGSSLGGSSEDNPSQNRETSNQKQSFIGILPSSYHRTKGLFLSTSNSSSSLSSLSPKESTSSNIQYFPLQDCPSPKRESSTQSNASSVSFSPSSNSLKGSNEKMIGGFEGNNFFSKSEILKTSSVPHSPTLSFVPSAPVTIPTVSSNPVTTTSSSSNMLMYVERDSSPEYRERPLSSTSPNSGLLIRNSSQPPSPIQSTTPTTPTTPTSFGIKNSSSADLEIKNSSSLFKRSMTSHHISKTSDREKLKKLRSRTERNFKSNRMINRLNISPPNNDNNNSNYFSSINSTTTSTTATTTTATTTTTTTTSNNATSNTSLNIPTMISNNSYGNLNLDYSLNRKNNQDNIQKNKEVIQTGVGIGLVRDDLVDEGNNGDEVGKIPPKKKVFKGYLKKMGHIRKTWKTRWFTLWPESNRLYYWKNELSSQPINFIAFERTTIIRPLDKKSVAQIYSPRSKRSASPLRGTQISPSKSSQQQQQQNSPPKNVLNTGSSNSNTQPISLGTNAFYARAAFSPEPPSFCFEIITSNRSYLLSAPTESERDLWISEIQKSILKIISEKVETISEKEYGEPSFSDNHVLDVIVQKAVFIPESFIDREISCKVYFPNYCKMRTKNVKCGAERHVSWCEDFSFVVPSDQFSLKIKISSHSNLIGWVTVNPKDLNEGDIVDQFYPINTQNTIEGQPSSQTSASPSFPRFARPLSPMRDDSSNDPKSPISTSTSTSTTSTTPQFLSPKESTPVPKWPVSPPRLHLMVQYIKRRRSSENELLGRYGSECLSIPMRLDTGDILLFNNSALTPIVIKMITSSVWDHVALVLRRKNGKLSVLEATGVGVQTYSLDEALDPKKVSCIIGVRRLNFTKTTNFRFQLMEFIRFVRGRPYEQNFFELMKAAAALNKTENLTSVFCSELVAAALQRVGVIKAEYVSNNFLPSDFGKASSEQHFVTPEASFAPIRTLTQNKKGLQKPPISIPNPNQVLSASTILQMYNIPLKSVPE